MSQSGPRSLRNYLSDDMFEQLGRELNWLRALERAWSERVPVPLVLYTRPISYRAGRLLVQAASSLWASRLRQQRERLIEALRRDAVFTEIAELRVRVAPLAECVDTERNRGANEPTLRLSAASAALIQALADDIADPGLKAALRRLGGRAKKGGQGDPGEGNPGAARS